MKSNMLLHVITSYLFNALMALYSLIFSHINSVYANVSLFLLLIIYQKKEAIFYLI
jgi:hypothetical protein